MDAVKQSLLELYVRASRPARAIRNQWLMQRDQAPVMVLFYHRVADEHPNAWTIGTNAFRTQMRWLKQNFDMVSLAEAQQRIRSGNPRFAVSVTFDDGYSDNCRFALPFLIDQQIPCTYFVTLDSVQHQTPFPHDAAAGIPLQPNTIEELREFSQLGIEVAAHTRTHPDIGSLTDPRQVYDEVVSASRELESEITQPVRYFAFPFGLHKNLHPEAFAMAREAGLEGVCSAYGAYNFPGEDPFHLRRIHGDPEFVRLRNWVTLDPRKRRVADFEYSQPALHQSMPSIAQVS